jgi:hypothetical protein
MNGDRQSDVKDDVPLTLKDAAERFGFSVSTLRAQAGRGTLTIYRIGRRLYTTPADVKEMVRRCRVEPKPSLTSQTQGRFQTDRPEDAQDRLREAVLMMRSLPRE